jgi:hypothetical protein
MGTTTRRRRGRRRGMAVGLALLVTATACGASGGGSVDAGPTPSRGPTTTAADGTGSTTGPDSTGGGSSGTGTGSGGSGTGGSGSTTQVGLYFTRGERIVRVSRAVPKVTAIGAETMKALVGGPTAAESGDGLGTAIPRETRFRGLNIAGGVARVDLSDDFESGGGSLSLSLRLAQVTCTLDQFGSVTGIRFLLDGRLVNVFSGNGIILDQPVSCADYAEHVAGDPAAEATFPGIWPFTSQAEMDDYIAGGDRTFTTPVETARQFAIRYVGMGDPVILGGPTVAAGGLVEVNVGFGTGEGGAPIANPQPTMSVFLRSGGADGDLGPWTVVSARSPQIVVDQPVALARVNSPVSVRGAAATFEGNVEVHVREDGMLADRNLGEGFVTGRGDGVLGPFAGQIPFDSPSKPAGAVVFFERSAADGQDVLRATVVRIDF